MIKRRYKQNAIRTYRQNKTFVNLKIIEYQDYVSKTLNNEQFKIAAETALPFDKFTEAKLVFVDDATIIHSLGFTLMKMDLEPATFSLGINIEMGSNEEGVYLETTIFILAGLSYEEIKVYVKSDEFLETAKYHFEQKIEKFCHDKRHNLCNKQK